jgi:CheY-like chemotaxis protein
MCLPIFVLMKVNCVKFGIEGCQTYHVLIAEDIRVNRQLLSRILCPLGFRTRKVSNGKESITVWQDWSPHLIWMDARMPILSEHETCYL